MERKTVARPHELAVQVIKALGLEDRHVRRIIIDISPGQVDVTIYENGDIELQKMDWKILAESDSRIE